MAGFSHTDFVGPVSCPHCESLDCAGTVDGGRGQERLVCITTQKTVTEAQLRQNAVAHGLASADDAERWPA